MGESSFATNSSHASRLLAGKYRLLRPLGQGGMGSVWQAEHLALQAPVAIKLLDPGLLRDPENVRRFLKEARAAAALRSPHVVQILDHGIDHELPYIVMEQLEGELLSDRFARCGRLSPAVTARIITHIARALSRAHAAGIVHRDLKPSNVFLVHDDDEEEIAKLFDFGVAKWSREPLTATVAGDTRPGVLVGTPCYMSPEQATGTDTIDHRTDIWALGVIAFEGLLGRRPFDAPTLPALLLQISQYPVPVPSEFGEVPTGFDAWFAHACARELERRFDSAKEAARELCEICAAGDLVSKVTSIRAPSLRALDSPLPLPAPPASEVNLSLEGSRLTRRHSTRRSWIWGALMGSVLAASSLAMLGKIIPGQAPSSAASARDTLSLGIGASLTPSATPNATPSAAPPSVAPVLPPRTLPRSPSASPPMSVSRSKTPSRSRQPLSRSAPSLAKPEAPPEDRVITVQPMLEPEVPRGSPPPSDSAVPNPPPPSESESPPSASPPPPVPPPPAPTPREPRRSRRGSVDLGI